MEEDACSMGAYNSLNILERGPHDDSGGQARPSDRIGAEPRVKKVKFNLLNNRTHKIPKCDKIIFDDLVCPSDEETAGWVGQEEARHQDTQCPIEIVIECPARAGAHALTRRMSQFSMVKNMFDNGIGEEEPPAKQIDAVFPKLNENPFIIHDRNK